jgi:hypothetical protein
METQRINELAGLMKKDVNSSFDEFYELTKKPSTSTWPPLFPPGISVKTWNRRRISSSWIRFQASIPANPR